MINVYSKEMGGVWYAAAVQDDQILATTFSFEEPDLRRLLQRLPDNVSFQVAEEPDQLLADVLGALEEIFNGKGRESYAFKINLNHLSSYTQKVLKCTRLVPVGYVTSYGAIAKVAGGGARAVGNVEASNHVHLLIPCHRVVRSDLSLGGYGGGEQLKLEILHREKRGYEESKRLEVEGKELALFPAEWVKPNRESF
ncbi:MAG: methylated-DNA--[protein]-cysteine S-methyltransferase [Candidatus Bathyarchaeota archaeon]|jgi:O-6-methylguanine DNA methyltransferase